MSNTKSGKRFEQQFCETLAYAGFWVHQISQNLVGQQPADVIAMHCGTAYLIDCKVCSDNRFYFSRIEENQRMAMDKWISCRGTMPKLALKDSGGIVWMLDYQWALAMEQAGNKSVDCERRDTFLIPLDEWVEQVT